MIQAFIICNLVIDKTSIATTTYHMLETLNNSFCSIARHNLFQVPAQLVYNNQITNKGVQSAWR